MGIDYQGLRFLLHAKKSLTNFKRTATLGRQRLDVDALTVNRCLAEDAFPQLYPISFINLLCLLEASEVHSFDISSYEGPSFLHDFNLPIPSEFHSSYDAVIDAGSLEHVFNLPRAIKNCLLMIKEGGHFISIAPANNWFGHGFYQIQPEFFFRVLSSKNGFQIKSMFAAQSTGDWTPILDTGRFPFTGNLPTYVMVLAQRVKQVPISFDSIQDSYYEKGLWKKT